MKKNICYFVLQLELFELVQFPKVSWLFPCSSTVEGTFNSGNAYFFDNLIVTYENFVGTSLKIKEGLLNKKNVFYGIKLTLYVYSEKKSSDFI